jgi:thiamine biosynthesis lipoprotein ApbE
MVVLVFHLRLQDHRFQEEAVVVDLGIVQGYRVQVVMEAVVRQQTQMV